MLRYVSDSHYYPEALYQSKIVLQKEEQALAMYWVESSINFDKVESRISKLFLKISPFGKEASRY